MLDSESAPGLLPNAYLAAERLEDTMPRLASASCKNKGVSKRDPDELCPEVTAVAAIRIHEAGCVMRLEHLEGGQERLQPAGARPALVAALRPAEQQCGLVSEVPVVETCL